MAIPLEVCAAEGVYLHLSSGQRLIDSISSWWAVIHGYKHPRLDAAADEQLKKMSHVMLGGLTHKPATDLADLLVSITPKPLEHVFFADSGSVGCEVALKMAIQYWQNQGKTKKTRILAFKKSYHGDTTGVMAVSDPDDSFHSTFKGLLLKQLFLEAPSDLKADEAALKRCLDEHHEHIAAIIIEPLVQAAGGFNFFEADFLNILRRYADRYNILLIFDEVATGFGRTGSLFACNQADVCPDIMVLGKGLTGGYLGLSATCVTERLFNGFYSDKANDAFMHGPTFMGNPLACRIAYESVSIFLEQSYLEKIKAIEAILKEELLHFTHDAVKNCRVLGAIGVIEVHKKEQIEKAQAFALENGVWLRPFEQYLYTMPPYIISDSELRKVCAVMKAYFNTIPS